MRRGLVFFGMLVLIAFVFVTCGDDPPSGPSNEAPAAATNNVTAGSPADEAVDIELEPELHWTCVDPDGDALTYVITFGAVNPPTVESVSQSAASFLTEALEYSTTYYWFVVAMDPDGEFSTSAIFSFTTIDAPESINAPNAPTGDVAGFEGQTLTFSVTGAVSSYEHQVEHQYDWGDGNISGWYSLTRDGTHIWETAGTYSVKVRARCVLHNDVVSDWSTELVVTISVIAPESVSAPSIPDGPGAGVETQGLTFTPSGAVSSYGDDVEYRFDWGDGSFSDWGTTTVQHSWTIANTYDVKVQARCIAHPTVTSDWSDAFVVTITVFVAETISAPAAPVGPSTGEENEGMEYSASGSISSYGDDVEYSFDWGDGVFSDWVTIPITYSWTTAGTYDVMAQARCVTHPTIMSEWSAVTTVTITVPPPETISTPPIPSGSGAAEEGVLINFALPNVTSSEGHALEYRFDWGDQTVSTWSSSASKSHSWVNAGTYEVKGQARCADHTTIESEWSAVKTVTISVPGAETISTPDITTGPTEGEPDQNIAYFPQTATSSDLHPVEYQIDWGGELQGWFPSLATGIQHSWSAEGTYDVMVRARCRTHTDIVGAWSAPLTVTISYPPETIPAPTDVTGPTDGGINESYEYSNTQSFTNLGHPIEMRYDWGNGEFSAWTNVRQASYTWTTEGTFEVRYEARCIEHPSIATGWSASLTVTIAAVALETVSKPPYFSMQNYQQFPETNVPTIYQIYGGTSSLQHDIETMVDWGDGTQSDWVPQSSEVTKTWTTEGNFAMTRISRCIAHPEIVSEISDQRTIYAVGPEVFTSIEPPVGDDTGVKMQYIYFDASATLNRAHGIEYRFDWGNGMMSTWATATNVRYRWNAVGVYDVTYQARCLSHPDIESVWSEALAVTITETITYRGSVIGPYEGLIGVPHTFEQNSEATSDEGHAVEYHFDLGDGTFSDWSTELTVTHAYTTPGQYSVLCQARCIEHPEAMSAWKATSKRVIEITDGPEAVDVPIVRVSYTVIVGEEARISAYGSNSNHGDSLEYQIDFGDGTVSDWFPTVFYFTFSSQHYWEMVPEWTQHIYTAVGSYGVKARARCVAHPTIVSDWSLVSQSTTMTVIESVSMPATPTGPTAGAVGETLIFSTEGSISSEGDVIEYYYSYRTASGQNAGASDGYTTALSHSISFASPGEYYVYVLAQCVEHNDAGNGWSEKFYFTIE